MVWTYHYCNLCNRFVNDLNLLNLTNFFIGLHTYVTTTYPLVLLLRYLSHKLSLFPVAF